MSTVTLNLGSSTDGTSMWLIQFMMSFFSGCIGALTPYVTSSFQLHSLTALTGVISSGPSAASFVLRIGCRSVNRRGRQAVGVVVGGSERCAGDGGARAVASCAQLAGADLGRV